MLTQRLPIKIKNDPAKIILQFLDIRKTERIKRIISCIESMTEEETAQMLNEVLCEFENRHKNFKLLLMNNYLKVNNYVECPEKYSEERKLLTGAYFSKEYSIEAAALFNPSIVEHPDQSGLKDGELRFVLSLRATGEGHISSIEFRSGILTSDNDIILDPISKYSVQPLNYKIKMLNSKNISFYETSDESSAKLNNANYDMNFDKESELSERVIFPFSVSETMGMEDVRFLKFTDDANNVKYYGTYTAYNGYSYKTQLIETTNFIDFNIRELIGDGVKDKGMALFPEKINGQYAMISREDSESIFILYSDTLYWWSGAKKILTPEKHWEYIQLGNCGSPLKTDKGWLLITHAVGPMRKYVISACLLDLNEPDKVIGRLTELLLSPNEDEREGYVPNVVYSCGPMMHNGELIIPYAMSDTYCGFAKVNVDQLINEILKK